MIRFSRIAAPVVGVGIATVYAASVAAVLLMVGGAILDPYESGCDCFDHDDADHMEVGTVTDRIKMVGAQGPAECKDAAFKFADLLENGQATTGHAYVLSDCFNNAGDNQSRLKFAEILIDELPENGDFYVIKGLAEYADGKIEATKKTLLEGLNHTEDPATLSILHNNYAWAALSSENPDLRAVDFHSRLALEFDSTECAAIHTRMTYEFAKNINKPSELRDLNGWINVREYYGTCLEMFQEPRFRYQGNFELSTISEQVFSTYVMDELLLSNLDVPYDAATYLAPTRESIYSVGVDAFCKSSMGLRNQYIQGACKQAVLQAEVHWRNR